MRDGRGRLLVTCRCLARLPLLPLLRLYRWLRVLARRIGLPRRGGRRRMLLVRGVGIIGVCAGGGFGRAAVLTPRGSSRKAAGLARAHLSARAAAMSATATATSPAAAPLAALSALASVVAIACNLTLLCARLDVRA